jgi:exopolyphosphatase/guanosine-5'-triphosphate,3'-diphosphate pyrophosphatase
VIRVAAIDCGTNSIRLLIADVDPGAGSLVDIDRRMEVVRLGEGVERTGRLDPAAIARTLAVAGEYTRGCRAAGVAAVRFVATSATRDARNRAEFVDGVRRVVGVDPEVVSGEEEARLSFVGATLSLGGRFPAPHLVVDIGGGSTEFVLGSDGVDAACSVDIGCVRITERHLRGDPPDAAQVAAAVGDVEAAIDVVAARVPLQRATTLVGLAGSVTTVTAHALRLPVYDSAALHGAALPGEAVVAACESLLWMPRAERASLPFMHPGRVDVIGAGALIWERVVRRVSVARAAAGLAEPVVVASEHDILDGIAWALARSHDSDRTEPTPGRSAL